MTKITDPAVLKKIERDYEKFDKRMKDIEARVLELMAMYSKEKEEQQKINIIRKLKEL